MDNSTTDTREINLRPIQFIWLGARIYCKIRGGATLYEVLAEIAVTAGVDPDDYVHSVRRVLDGDGIEL